jgi:hypothetical protein
MRTQVLILGMALTLSFAHAAEPQIATKEAPLRFTAYDGDPRQAEKLIFQISFDGRQPSAFVKVGESVRAGGTLYTLKSFQHKTQPHPTLGSEDVSELTVVNAQTGESLTLPIARVRELATSPR